ncbi:MAG: YHS domain-containing protein [Acidobacteriaceae bacterium]|nr:YHS domain-containing protein [Acidobacteriaceae bacterium]
MMTDVNQDLVCQMQITEEKPKYFSDYNGRMYPFCSAECKRKFDDHPDTFIQQHAKEELGIQ